MTAERKQSVKVLNRWQKWLGVASFALLTVSLASAAELRLERDTSADAVTLRVVLNSVDKPVTGIQFDLAYDTTVLNVSIETGPAAEAASKTVRASGASASGQRVLVVGFNRISFSTGNVAVLRVSPKPGETPRRSYKILLTAPAGTNGDGQVVPMTTPDSFMTFTFDHREGK
jgi:Cohesin domain